MDLKIGIVFNGDNEGFDICLSEAVALTDETGEKMVGISRLYLRLMLLTVM